MKMFLQFILIFFPLSMVRIFLFKNIFRIAFQAFANKLKSQGIIIDKTDLNYVSSLKIISEKGIQYFRQGPELNFNSLRTAW